MAERFSPAQNDEVPRADGNVGVGQTRREGLAAAVGGVAGVLAAQTLGRPATARASHLGPVELGHRNEIDPGVTTSIVSAGPRVAFRVANTALERPTRGILGESWSRFEGSAGVRGVATAEQGAAIGVHGASLGQEGTGVLGEANHGASGGFANGVHGRSDTGVGVRADGGYAGVSASGGAVGVGGEASPGGIGVLALGGPKGPFPGHFPNGLALQTQGPANIIGDLIIGTTYFGTAPAFRVEVGTPASGETAMLVRRNIGGAVLLQRVSVGDPNSGGAGFRVLRVPN